MKSFISSAVLGAAALTQAASLHHNHAHQHRREAAAATPALEARDVNVNTFITAADTSMLQAKRILIGKNVPAGTAGAPVTVGGKGPFLVEFQNKSPLDMVVTTWSGCNQANPWDAMFLGAAQPDITHTLAPNENVTVSFSPDDTAEKSISGGFGAIFAHNGLSPVTGQLNETFVEYTFTTQTEFSTTDVSRLVNMNGRQIEVHNYRYKTDAEPLCTSTNTKCAFVCPDGQDNCNPGTLLNCPAGTPYTTSNESGKDGGCGGLLPTGGYVKVNFF